MRNSVSPITQVVATGVGAALFFVLGRFVILPAPVPNTSINLQYAILAVFAVLYGPIVGFAAGAIGHVLIDATGYGLWYSWEIATAVFGLLLGWIMLKNLVREGIFDSQEILKFNIAVVVAHAVSWLVIAPSGDVLFYGEPAVKVFAQGLVAFLSNSIITCVLGTLILVAYAKTRTKTGSLETSE